jgi:hypothetical protein
VTFKMTKQLRSASAAHTVTHRGYVSESLAMRTLHAVQSPGVESCIVQLGLQQSSKQPPVYNNDSHAELCHHHVFTPDRVIMP